MDKNTNLKNLPRSMAERAIWSRNEFIKNPLNSQIDDDTLIWCFNSEDGLWYSILGNYSSFSPEEKRLKDFERENRYAEKEIQAQEMAKEYYQRIFYYSDLRKKVLERDNYTCQDCGKIGNTKFHIHHIHKKVEGGSDCLDNLITLCPKCHSNADRSEYNPQWE